MNKKGFIRFALLIIFLIVLLGAVYFVYNNYFGTSQEVKINSIEITNVYRNCGKNANENYIDTTIQTTIKVDVTKNRKYSQRIGVDPCNVKIGPNDAGGVSVDFIPKPEPYVGGIFESGLYMVTGGELIGDRSDTLTVCCRNKCDVANIEICA